VCGICFLDFSAHQDVLHVNICLYVCVVCLFVHAHVPDTIFITLPFEVSVVVVYQAESLGNFPDVSIPLRGLVFKSLILFRILQGLSQSSCRFVFKP
jgi:hypothetical protein